MTQAPFAVPHQLGPYKIIREIGYGQMGTVYEAVHTGLDRSVALKVLHPRSPERVHIANQFVWEARSIARLEHPNIVAVHDAGQIGGLSYIAMKLLDGENLQTILDRTGFLPVSRVLRIAAQLARALDYAHTREIVHLDVKPANIVVTQGDHVTLTDFGIARPPLAGNARPPLVTGTPRYMSPEQCFGHPVDCRSDIYSLGIVMYHMCTGRTPFGGRPIAVMYAQVYTPVPDMRTIRADIPEALSALIHRALEKEPSLRFQTAAELYRALERLAQEVGEPVGPYLQPTLLDAVQNSAVDGALACPAPPTLSPAFFAGEGTVALDSQAGVKPRRAGPRSRPKAGSDFLRALSISSLARRPARLLIGGSIAGLAAVLAAVLVPLHSSAPPATASSPPQLVLSVSGSRQQRGEYASGQGVILRWSRAPGAAIYRVQIARGASSGTGARIFNHPFETDLVDGTSQSLRVLGRQVYYWRIQPQINGRWAGYSAPSHFTVAAPVIKPPAPREPGNGTTTVATHIKLCWTPVQGAFAYRVRVGGSSGLSTHSTCLWLPVQPQRYVWTVTALGQGVHIYSGQPSPRWHFTVLPRPTPAPPTPTTVPARQSTPPPTVMPPRHTRSHLPGSPMSPGSTYRHPPTVGVDKHRPRASVGVHNHRQPSAPETHTYRQPAKATAMPAAAPTRQREARHISGSRPAPTPTSIPTTRPAPTPASLPTTRPASTPTSLPSARSVPTSRPLPTPTPCDPELTAC